MSTTFLNKFIKNFIWMLTGSISSTFINFFSSLIIVINLTVFDYGMLTLALSTTSILFAFVGLGIDSVVTAEINQERGAGRLDKAKKILHSFSKLYIIMGVVFSISIFLFSDALAELLSKPEVSGLLKIASLTILMYTTKAIFRLIFHSSLHFKYFSMMEIAESFSRLGMILCLITMGLFNLQTAFLSYPLSIAISTSLSSLFLHKSLSIYTQIKASKENLLRKMIFQHGKYAVIRTLFNTVTNNITVWLIELLLNVEAVGIFALARRILTFMRIFLTSLEGVLIPTISYEITRNKERVKRIFTRGIKYGLIVSSIVTLLAIIFIVPLLNFLGLEKYYPSIPVFNIIILHLIVVGASYLMRPLFFALKAQKELTLIYIFDTFLYSALLFILIYLTNSPVGAAAAVVLNGVIIVFIRYWILVRLNPSLKISPKELLKIDTYDKKMLTRVWKGVKRRARV